MNTVIDCDECGIRVRLIWDEQARAWTGICLTCGTITYATKEEVIHEHTT